MITEDLSSMAAIGKTGGSRSLKESIEGTDKRLARSSSLHLEAKVTATVGSIFVYNYSALKDRY
jgi:hypothetical protein